MDTRNIVFIYIINYRSRKRRFSVKNASRSTSSASRTGRIGRRSVKRIVTVSAIHAVIVRTNGDVRAVATGSVDVTRLRRRQWLEIELINFENITLKNRTSAIKQQDRN